MFLRSFSTSLSLYRKCMISGTNKIVNIKNSRLLSGYAYCHIDKYKVNTLLMRISVFGCRNCKCQVIRYYSVLDGDVTDLTDAVKERELTNVSLLFPKPRVTLNEYATRAPSSVFSIHYRQSNIAPKGAKHTSGTNDWTCTYEFVWPEKIKFESAERSKSRAAEKAALLALHWLYKNKRIDNKGFPVYDKAVIEKLSRSIEEPIRASISQASMERVEKIWGEYENEIKNIYERTFSEAKHRQHKPQTTIIKDSTLEEEDQLAEDGSFSANDSGDLAESQVPVHPVYCKHVPRPTETQLDRRKKQLMLAFRFYEENRTPLPIDDYIDAIASTVSAHPATVVVGAAGCGKSTRVPLAPLRAARAAVLVTGPRRVAAVGLARRVAAELGERVGETVGYQVRLDSLPPRPPAGSILYCTSGVLLRRLQTNPGLQGCTHVFIDEAHERDVNTDLSLLLLKRATRLNPELRVIVMSATLDTEVFSKYFDSCPVIEVPGRTFPVETSYLDDIRRKYNLELSSTFENCSREDGKPLLVDCKEIVEVIKAVDRTEPEGAILVFLPGWADIKLTKELLAQSCGDSTHLILPVHSRLSTTDQAKMFSRPMPGVRKIVLATNIAETSVTIPDVVYVIDSGLHKEKRINEGTGAPSLQTAWASRAAARQRAGRAGRLQPGHCYKLYTEQKENEFDAYTTPEILRVPLEQTVLDCKTYAPDERVENFLSELPEPPTKKAIQLAVDDLVDLGALTPCEQLTRLGRLLARLPLPARLARGALVAATAGTTRAAAAIAAHATTAAELFDDAGDRREEIRELKRQFSPTSDHAALRWIQEEFERVVRERGWQEADSWCKRYGLRRDRLAHTLAISNLYLELLVRSPVVQPSPQAEDLDRFSAVDELAAAALLCGAGTLLVARPRLRRQGKLMPEVGLVTSQGERAHIGSGSVNHGATRGAILAYHGGLHSAPRRALVAHATTRVAPHAAAILCQGSALVGECYEDTTVLNLPRHNLQIHVPTSQVDHILHTKEMFANTFQYYVERDPNSVSYEENTTVSRFKVRLIKTICRILVEAHREFEEKTTVTVDEFR